MNFFGKKVAVRVAGVLTDERGILLIAHKKSGRIYWLLPGGGVNYGESQVDALKREFLEELNIEVEVGEPVLLFDSIEPSGKRHIINICFFCSYAGGDYQLGKETRLHDYGFFLADRIPELAMYPPIHNELREILHSRHDTRYLGKLWMKD